MNERELLDQIRMVLNDLCIQEINENKLLAKQNEIFADIEKDLACIDANTSTL